ncbi:restriction endonuclease [Serratia marcescens]
MANVNTEYEKLTQEIYQSICNAEGVKNISVQHNVKALGKSGCNHQIDVYWEFELMGVKHRVAIECKNYSSEVSVGKVRDFFGVLHDISNITGIFVTKVGYQSGAVKFANYYGINLKEIRVPTAMDWEGRVKDIILTITAFFAIIKKRDIQLDFEWIRENTGMREGDIVDISGMANELKIVNANGELITTLYDIENELPRDVEEIDKIIKREFNDAFITTPSGDKFKILGISYLYDVVSESETSTSEGDLIARAILKDVDSGSIKFFNQSGNIHDVRDV